MRHRIDATYFRDVPMFNNRSLASDTFLLTFRDVKGIFCLLTLSISLKRVFLGAPLCFYRSD